MREQDEPTRPARQRTAARRVGQKAVRADRPVSLEPALSKRAARRRRSRIVDIFEDGARACASMTDLTRLLADVTGELGFRYFALLHHRRLLTDGPHLIRADNYPSAWEAELLLNYELWSDPVHVASTRTNAGFAWDAIGRLVRLTSGQRRILEASRRYGIGTGFTVPANVPGEPSGSVSFAVARGRTLPRDRLDSAEIIGAHACSVARRLHGLPAMGRPPRLSRRELQCLRLLAAGKTDWENAAILDLSVETAHQYVKRARAAYDVVTRTQLVVHGLRDTLISFDDAIPPSG